VPATDRRGRPFLPPSHSRRLDEAREQASVAYRTRRAFRAQYELLLAASMFEEAAGRLDRVAGRPVAGFRWRLAREVDKRRIAFDERLHAFRTETMQLLAPADFLSGIDRLLEAHDPLSAGTVAPAAPARSPTVPGWLVSAALRTSTYGCAAAWAATADEVLARGITNRPSLIIAEISAMVLSPAALFQSAAQAVPRHDDSSVADHSLPGR
jgi:hypothetical protein